MGWTLTIPAALLPIRRPERSLASVCCWTMLLTYLLMVGIQIISAEIGRVSGHGLATNIRQHYPARLLYSIVGLLLIANTINIAADVAAMADALKLMVGGPVHWYAIGFGVISLLLQIFIPCSRYVRILKWLTLTLLAYVATAFVMEAGIHHHYRRRFRNHYQSLSFFWKASQEVEEQHANPQASALKDAPEQASANFRRIKIDNYIGMGFSNLVAFFIILTTAITLHLHGATEIPTSTQAAAALRPIAGEFAFWLFSAGIIGTGLLAIPVLAGSAAYAMADAFHWRNSLELKPDKAKGFYGIIVISTLIDVGLCFTPINPIKALYWSAVINGVISVPIMAVMLKMAARPDIMGQFVISRRLKALGWVCIAVMAIAVFAMLWSLGM